VDLSRLIRVFVNNQESHKRSVKWLKYWTILMT
jgi:hypothetical protein